MALEEPLKAERAAVDAELRAHAIEATADFSRRYDDAIRSLQSLWNEADLLSKALRCAVPTPLLIKLTTSPVDGSTQVVPARTGVAVAVEPAATKLGEQLDRLDTALGLCNAVRQSHGFDMHRHRLDLLRGTASEHSGVYRVLLTFRNLVDGLEFQPGELIDSSLVGSGMMARLQVGRRHVEPANLSAAA